MESSLELYHHGIKGQKWGIRRFQNSDGSLTDEGRRRYGYGSERGKLMTQNTKEYMKKGAKIGAGIGGVFGGIGGVTTAASALAWGVAPPLAVAAGASYLASSVVSSTIDATIIGGIVGAIDTHKGRQYIERFDKDLDKFEMRDLKKNG